MELTHEPANFLTTTKMENKTNKIVNQAADIARVDVREAKCVRDGIVDKGFTRVYQTIRGNKNANCLQACVASYLNLSLEDVPNFMLFDDYWWDALVWLFLGKGYDVGYVDGLTPVDGKIYITSIESGYEDCTHAVLTRDNIVVHDPTGTINKENKIVGYYSISKRPA